MPAEALQAGDADVLERQKIASAIRTDFILSAEIMAITLSTVGEASCTIKATVLVIVRLGITIAFYGTVALVVKADDAGVTLPVAIRLGRRSAEPCSTRCGRFYRR